MARTPVFIAAWLTTARIRKPSKGSLPGEWEKNIECIYTMQRCANSPQSCPTVCDPVDCSPPGSSLHGILQARVLEWVVASLLQGIFPTQGLNLSLLHWLVDSLPSEPRGKPSSDSKC